MSRSCLRPITVSQPDSTATSASPVASTTRVAGTALKPLLLCSTRWVMRSPSCITSTTLAR